MVALIGRRSSKQIGVMSVLIRWLLDRQCRSKCHVSLDAVGLTPPHRIFNFKLGYFVRQFQPLSPAVLRWHVAGGFALARRRRRRSLKSR